MRILFLTQYFPPEIGAPQVRLAAMIRELVQLGHEVEVVTALPNHPTGRLFPGYARTFYRQDDWSGVAVHRVWLYAALGGGLKRIFNYASFTLTSLYGLLRCKRPDLIFVESPPLTLSVPAWLLGLVWRVPFLFNVADLWPDSVRELGLIRNETVLRLAERLERWSYRKAAFVNAVTHGIRETLIRQKDVPSEKVLFLPNGVDTNLFQPRPYDHALAEKLGLAGKRVIVYAGTLGFAQGLEVALSAMERLRDELPDVQLVFLGDGSERKALEAIAAKKRLGNVMFLAPRPLEFVARLYAIAEAGFASLKDLPLFEGARPSKIFPIMASGKPVLYSGAGEGARLVESAQAGLVARPEDPEALAEAIRHLMRDPAHGEALGRNGRRYVETNLSWQALIQDWVAELKTRLPVRKSRAALSERPLLS